MSRFRVQLRMSLRLLWRDWKSGELNLLMASLVVAVAIVTGITLFTDRLERALLGETSFLLAADRLISGSAPVPTDWLQEARRQGLATASIMLFPSMLSTGSRHQLVSVKAVSEGYPLRGHLVISDAPFTAGQTTFDIPAPGEVWLDSRLFPSLGVKLKDSIQLGISHFRITRALISEPDRGGDVFGLGPRLLMRMSDVPATNLVQSGSRINYRALLAGTDSQLGDFYDWLRPQLPDTAFAWLDIANSSPAISGALRRAERFLLLGGLLGVILAGIALALVARRYSTRQFDRVAVLKTLGETPGGIAFSYTTSLILLAFAAILTGLALGFFMQTGAERLFGQFAPIKLPPPGIRPFLTGAMTGLICLLTFALPPVLALRKVAPVRVMRRDFDEMGTSSSALYVLGTLGAVSLLLWYSADLTLAVLVLLGLVLVVSSLLLIVRLLLLAGRSLGVQAGSAWRLAFAGIQRRHRDSSAQILTFSLVLALLLLLILVRMDLLTEWRSQLPKDAANHFLLNVTEDQKQSLNELLRLRTKGDHQFFPSLRGRMTHIGGEPVAVREARHETEFSGGPRATSERNLTWSVEFPLDNELVAGQWWGDEIPATPLVSIESYIAELLQASIGEKILFQIADRTIEAEIASIRKVKWDGFRPNFYIMFSPGVLEEFPGTWITSFYLPPDQKLFLNELLHLFPTVTVIEIDVLIAQVQFMIERISLAIQLVLILVLVAGVFVLLASIRATLDERRRECALLSALGARREKLLSALAIEFAALGLCSGVLASIGAEVAAFFLWREVFELDALWHPVLWGAAPLLGLVIIGTLGLLSTWRVLYVPPLLSLRAT